MKRLRMLLIASALMAGGTALASAQPRDHDDRGYRDRDDRHFDRDDRRFVRRGFDRDDHRYFVGERRFFNGYYWTWDGGRWCRRDGRAVFYFGF
jgi:Ni/Co efflux regulator RcnB